MRILNIFNRHNALQAQASAYADGELAGRELERFEAHVASCARCGEAVAMARVVKSALQALPMATAPRSFRITPVMAAEARPAPARAPGVPLYLGLARAGTAFAVVAFVSVVAFSALDSSNGTDEVNTASRQAEAAAYDTAGGAPPTEKDALSASETATPQLAQPSSGEAAGSGVATPAPTVSREPLLDTASATPVAADPVRASSDDGDTEALSTVGTAFAPEDDDGPSIAVVSLGVLAAGTVVLLFGLETARRLRRN